MMSFPLFSRFRRPGPPLDNRGPHLQRPPPITHVPRHHLGLVPPVHRGYHRHQHQSSLVPVPRLPRFWRRDSPRPTQQIRPRQIQQIRPRPTQQIRPRPTQQIRPQPKPPGRSPMNCLHIHFHGTPKPHRGAPVPRLSKNGHKQPHHSSSSHKDSEALSRHVHWVPPQPAQRQHHSSHGPSHTSSRGPAPPAYAPAHAPAHAPAPIPSHAPARAPSHAAPRAPSHAAPRAPSHAAPRAPSHAATRAPSHAATHAPSHAPTAARSNAQPRQPSNPPPDSRPQQARSSRGQLQQPQRRK
ncbi:hypothetical protein BDN67DRAFT_555760 [Paxillus ammoniavirescens]|nr:hypothetical protein BDN67DRAFT_555760 [Paxillus ammoniavirescens]